MQPATDTLERYTFANAGAPLVCPWAFGLWSL